MRTLTSAARRALRARAHALHPYVTVGHHGLTPSVLHEIDVSLLAHELIKIRVQSDDRDEREALLARMCAELDAAPVQHIGKLLVVWRPKPPPEAPAAKSRTKGMAATADKRRERNTATVAGAAGKAAAGPRAPAKGRSSGKSTGKPGRGKTFGATATASRRSRGAGIDPYAGEPEPDEAHSRRRRTTAAPPGSARGPSAAGAKRGATGAPARPPRAPGGAKPAAKRPSGPHGKSASSQVGAAGARRRRRTAG